MLKNFILLIPIIFFLACSESKSPNSQFNQLDEQLENSKTTNKNSLNLEATIKVIFTLDEAIKNVKDVQEYTEYLYKQDMTGVAPDVISSYQKLLPVLDNLYDAEAEKELNEDLWLVFSELVDVQQTLINAGAQAAASDFMGAAVTALQAKNDAKSNSVINTVSTVSIDPKIKTSKACSKRKYVPALSEKKPALPVNIEVVTPLAPPVSAVDGGRATKKKRKLNRKKYKKTKKCFGFF
jgi:hypothetical protein